MKVTVATSGEPLAVTETVPRPAPGASVVLANSVLRVLWILDARLVAVLLYVTGAEVSPAKTRLNVPVVAAFGIVSCCTALVASPLCPVVSRPDTAPPSAPWKVMSRVDEVGATTDVKPAIEGPPTGVRTVGVMVVVGDKLLLTIDNALVLVPPRAFWKVMVTRLPLPALTEALVVLVGVPFTVTMVANALSAFWIFDASVEETLL